MSTNYYKIHKNILFSFIYICNFMIKYNLITIFVYFLLINNFSLNNQLRFVIISNKNMK